MIEFHTQCCKKGPCDQIYTVTQSANLKLVAALALFVGQGIALDVPTVTDTCKNVDYEM